MQEACTRAVAVLAFRSPSREKWISRIELEVLPALTVLPYDVAVARTYGEVRAGLEASGQLPGEIDLMIAATALRHRLVVVTGNVRHFKRIPGLEVDEVLSSARAKARR